DEAASKVGRSDVVDHAASSGVRVDVDDRLDWIAERAWFVLGYTTGVATDALTGSLGLVDVRVRSEARFTCDALTGSLGLVDVRVRREARLSHRALACALGKIGIGARRAAAGIAGEALAASLIHVHVGASR